jgi:hypothetical protein
MGCIETIEYVPNIYILTVLFCFIFWSIKKKKLTKIYITPVSLSLIVLSVIFPSECSNGCSFPCNLHIIIIMLGIVLIPIILLIVTAKFIYKKLNKPNKTN